MSEKIPPNKGPVTNPKPEAEAIMLKFFVLLCSLDRSEVDAKITPRHPAPMPAIILPRNNKIILSDLIPSMYKIKDKTIKIIDKDIIFFLP